MVAQILPELTNRKGSCDKVEPDVIFSMGETMSSKVVSKLHKEQYRDRLDTMASELESTPAKMPTRIVALCA